MAWKIAKDLDALLFFSVYDVIVSYLVSRDVIKHYCGMNEYMKPPFGVVFFQKKN